MGKLPEKDIEYLIKSLQEIFRNQDEIFNKLDKLKESIDINTEAITALNKWFKHLQEFERSVFKHFLRDDKPPYNPFS